MQRLINQLYWSTNATFANGTQMKMAKNRRIHLHNFLMAPGRAIIHWDSSQNYQANKTVPQLPILKVGQEYRLVAHMATKPSDTYLIRLIFRDIQGTEIKRIDFHSLQRKFVFPEEAVTYSLEIINSGFYDLEFDRIEIGPANLPLDAYGDIYAQRSFNQVTAEYPLNIILISDGKQARRIYSATDEWPTALPIQVINVSWQFDGDLRKWLKKWLSKQGLSSLHLISASPRFDELVIDLAKHYPNVDFMVTTGATAGQLGPHSWRPVNNSWLNSNVADVNWQNLLYQMKNVWEGVNL